MSDDDKGPQSMEELERMRSGGARQLPATFVDRQSGRQFTKGANVCSVTEEDIRRFSSGGHVCGECRHFEAGHGMAIIARTKFVRELVKDYEWNPAHAGMVQEKANDIGLCGDAGDMATSAMTAACENFRENRGRIKKEVSPEQRKLVVNDMRAAKQDHEERFEKFKRDNNLDTPEIVGD